MKTPVVAGVVLLTAVLAFVVGRATGEAPPAEDGAPVDDPGEDVPSGSGPGGAKVGTGDKSGAAATKRSGGTAPDEVRPSGQSPTSPSAPTDGIATERVALTAEQCEAELEKARTQLVEIADRKKELEGEPIPAKENVAPRFQQQGLVSTFNRAFQATKLAGKVESVDCTEHPCIVFGRLQGDEEAVATLEDSKPFAAYDDDIGVMLTWASGDHAHGGETKPGVAREKPPEVSLFAFAYYTDEERDAHGEAIDRRIRVRTAEYWNASTHRE